MLDRLDNSNYKLIIKFNFLKSITINSNLIKYDVTEIECTKYVIIDQILRNVKV